MTMRIQGPEQLFHNVTELYRLAFLITAERDLSIELAVNALALHRTPGLSVPDSIAANPQILVIAEA